MWKSILGGLIGLLSSWVGGRRDVGQRKNSPAMVANTAAKDEAKATDTITVEVVKAAAGDQKSLEELRHEAAE